MNLECIKQRLAPCGLHCGKCFAFKDGEIARLSAELNRALGNFAPYAERFVSVLEAPVFLQYPAFSEFLRHLSAGGCDGCRKEKCKIAKSCNVRLCSEEKGVDFCFQCQEFPCDSSGFDENLYARHIAINMRMKEVGVEEYYNEIRDTQRY